MAIPIRQNVKRALAVLLGLTAFLMSGVATSNISVIAPTFDLQGEKGRISLESYRGRVVYVDFWASWCVACKTSFPWMNDVHARYVDQGLEIVAINLGEQPADAKKFLEHTRPQFTIAYDPEGTSAVDYRVKAMPSSYLVGRNGELIWQHFGFRSKDTDVIEAQIRSALKEDQ